GGAGGRGQRGMGAGVRAAPRGPARRADPHRVPRAPHQRQGPARDGARVPRAGPARAGAREAVAAHRGRGRAPDGAAPARPGRVGPARIARRREHEPGSAPPPDLTDGRAVAKCATLRGGKEPGLAVHPQHIVRRDAGTSTTSSVMRTTVPPETLLSGVGRLRLLAFVLGGIYTVVAILGFALPALGVSKLPGIGDGEFIMFLHDAHIVHALGIGLAAAMIAISYWRALAPETILAVGLVFQVLGSLVFSL